MELNCKVFVFCENIGRNATHLLFDMRRTLLLVAIILAVMLTGCGASNASEASQPVTQNNPPAESEPVQPVMPGESPGPTEPTPPVEPDNPQANPEVQSVAEYIRITPQEALKMMSDDVIVLDVRTQAEFDEGHIMNAVLLPDFEIAQRAESVLTDKDQTILVYCRAGRRSEASSRLLIEMGYTKVYDFGGIQSWTGEIVQ